MERQPSCHRLSRRGDGIASELYIRLDRLFHEKYVDANFDACLSFLPLFCLYNFALDLFSNEPVLHLILHHQLPATTTTTTTALRAALHLDPNLSSSTSLLPPIHHRPTSSSLTGSPFSHVPLFLLRNADHLRPHLRRRCGRRPCLPHSAHSRPLGRRASAHRARSDRSGGVYHLRDREVGEEEEKEGGGRVVGGLKSGREKVAGTGTKEERAREETVEVAVDGLGRDWVLGDEAGGEGVCGRREVINFASSSSSPR